MNKFGLVVEFEVQPEDADRFFELITENARLSVEREPGCLRFDVLRAQDNPARFMLYEIYTDGAAVQEHMKMPHVTEFFGKAKPLIVKQAAHRLTRVAAPQKK